MDDRHLTIEDAKRIIKTGVPGAVTITQIIHGRPISWWTPAINEIPISSTGDVLQFSNPSDALDKAIELQKEAIARREVEEGSP
jgi:hypothetical protein